MQLNSFSTFDFYQMFLNLCLIQASLHPSASSAIKLLQINGIATYCSSGIRQLHGDPLLSLQLQLRSTNSWHFWRSIFILLVGCIDAGVLAVVYACLLSRTADMLIDNKPGKVCTYASLLSILIETLLVSRREFSELMVLA